MRRFLYIAICSSLFFMSSGLAEAHVFVKDTKGLTGAILHVNPDDDPYAGQESNLYYDLQNAALTRGGFGADLKVTDTNGKSVDVPLGIAANSVSADYVFPTQGVYKLQLLITENDTSYQFDYSQRVERGGDKLGGNRVIPPWAHVAVIGSAVSLFSLIIIVYNRFSDILRQSRG